MPPVYLASSDVPALPTPKTFILLDWLLFLNTICKWNSSKVSLFHTLKLLFRSPWAVPGLWLLSLTLAGVRQRSQGSLFLPIGLRSGIVASSYILHTGGFLTYQPKFPPWFTGSYPTQPFSGVVGFAFALSLAILLYPGEPLRRKKTARKIKE